jgi:hypothetical protein
LAKIAENCDHNIDPWRCSCKFKSLGIGSSVKRPVLKSNDSSGTLMKIFSKKLGEKMAFSAQTTARFCKKINHNIVFFIEKGNFFRQK